MATKSTTRLFPLITAIMVLLSGIAVYYVIQRRLGPPKSPPPPTTIRILGEDSSNLAALRMLAPEYKKQTGVEVAFTAQTFDQLQKTADSALQHHSPTYDIILNYNFSLASYVRNHWVYTLAELKEKLGDPLPPMGFESDIFENAWHEVGFYRKGHGLEATDEPIGYPFAANTMLLCYNKRLFENQANQTAYQAKYHKPLQPPRDWAELRQIAQFFTNRSKGTYGIAMQGAAGGWLYYEWVNFAFGMGGGVMAKRWGWEGDQHSPLLLETPETIAATKLYLSLKPYVAGDYFSTDAIVQREAMKTGNVAMAIMWSDYIYDMIFDDRENHSDEFGFAPIPGDKSMLAGGIFYVNRYSRNPSQAARFVIYVMQKDHQAYLMRKGLASALRTAYSDPEVQKLPYVPALKKSLDRGVYMNEANIDATAVSDILTKYLQQMWRGQIQVEAGLHAAAEEIGNARVDLFRTP